MEDLWLPDADRSLGHKSSAGPGNAGLGVGFAFPCQALLPQIPLELSSNARE